MGAVAAVVAALGSIAGIWVAIRHHGRSGRRHRVSGVVREYVTLAAEPQVCDVGPSAFVTAGAKDLKDDDEVREAIRRIVDRLGEARHPLGGHREDVPDGVDLKRDIVDRLDQDGANLREIVEDLRRAV